MALSRDPFFSAKLRFTRAKAQAANLHAGFKAFLDCKPETVVTEFDAEENTIVKLKLTKPMPDELSCLTIEIIEGLRASLDLLAYGAAVAAKSQRLKYTAFPFGDDLAGAQNSAAGWSKDIPAEIVSIFLSFRPHKGGNDALWAMNKTRNVGMHNLIAPIGMPVGQINANRGGISMFGDVRMPMPNWDTEKDEMVMFIVGPKGKVDYNFGLSYYLAFGEVNYLKGANVLGFFGKCCTDIEEIIAATETECRRLGFT